MTLEQWSQWTTWGLSLIWLGLIIRCWFRARHFAQRLYAHEDVLNRTYRTDDSGPRPFVDPLQHLQVEGWRASEPLSRHDMIAYWRAAAQADKQRMSAYIEMMPQFGLLGTVLSLFLSAFLFEFNMTMLGFALATTVFGLTGALWARSSLEVPSESCFFNILELLQNREVVHRLVAATHPTTETSVPAPEPFATANDAKAINETEIRNGEADPVDDEPAAELHADDEQTTSIDDADAADLVAPAKESDDVAGLDESDDPDEPTDGVVEDEVAVASVESSEFVESVVSDDVIADAAQENQDDADIVDLEVVTDSDEAHAMAIHASAGLEQDSSPRDVESESFGREDVTTAFVDVEDAAKEEPTDTNTLVAQLDAVEENEGPLALLELPVEEDSKVSSGAFFALDDDVSDVMSDIPSLPTPYDPASDSLIDPALVPSKSRGPVASPFQTPPPPTQASQTPEETRPAGQLSSSLFGSERADMTDPLFPTIPPKGATTGDAPEEASDVPDDEEADVAPEPWRSGS